MDSKEVLSTGQAAKRLGISTRTLHRWEAAGIIHPVGRLPSGQRRFAVRDVEGLLRGGDEEEKQAVSVIERSRGRFSWAGKGKV
jgi:predicted site-specific integrase-resolvase